MELNPQIHLIYLNPYQSIIYPYYTATYKTISSYQYQNIELLQKKKRERKKCVRLLEQKFVHKSPAGKTTIALQSWTRQTQVINNTSHTPYTNNNPAS